MSVRVIREEPKPWPELVEFLERKLEQAKRGELASFAVVWTLHTGDEGWKCMHDEGARPDTTIANLERLKIWALNRFKGTEPPQESE